MPQRRWILSAWCACSVHVPVLYRIKGVGGRMLISEEELTAKSLCSGEAFILDASESDVRLASHRRGRARARVPAPTAPQRTVQSLATQPPRARGQV